MSDGAPLSRRSVLGGWAALAGSTLLAAPAKAGAARRPNVVFILADDLGAFDLSCYGRPDYRTPRIDSLARDGVKLAFGYSSSATCTPTRVALFSGRYPNRVPVGTVAGGGATSDTVGFSPEWPSLARAFQQSGYRTALIGKWNLGPLPNFGPLKSGYDEFFGFSGGAIDHWSHDRGSPYNPAAERVPDFYEGEKPVTAVGYSTDLFTRRACEFIGRHRAKPFFLSLHYSAPHWPWQSREEAGAQRFADAHYDGGSMGLFAKMMAALDDGVGQVLDTLDRHGLGRDTIVVFTSDNGGERYSYMWPLRGAKGDLLEGGVRVPALVRWPAAIAAGKVTEQVSLSMDWLPTLAAMAGIALDGAVAPDGADLSPQLLGAASSERTVFWKTPGALSALAFPWKYLRVGEREHLYNMREDVSENANFKRREPAIFAKLAGAASAWEKAMLPSPPPRPAEAAEAIRAVDVPPAPPR